MLRLGRLMSVRSGLTSLSGHRLRSPRLFQRISSKGPPARALLVASLTTVTGCLVEAPPDFQRTRPFLYDAEPPVVANLPLQLNVGSPVTFSARVWSQEPNESIDGFLFLDQRRTISGYQEGAIDRELAILWTPGETDQGCHWVTLHATYAGNWSLAPGTGTTIEFDDFTLIDEERWWVQVGESTLGCGTTGGDGP